MVGTALVTGLPFYAHASQQDIATINAASCERLKSSYNELIRAFVDTPGSVRPTQIDGLINMINSLSLTKGEFGKPEMNALISHLKSCDENFTAKWAKSGGTGRDGTEVPYHVLQGWDGNDYFGVIGVENHRAQVASAKKAAEQRAAQIASDKQARDQAVAEAKEVLDGIHQLSASKDLVSTYNEVATLNDRIGGLPSDLKSDLQDALQIAMVPIDKQRNAVLSKLQSKLLAIQKLPDNEEKLHALSDLAQNVQLYSQVKDAPEAATLTEMVENTRDATRAKVGESANALDATTTAESNKLKAAADDLAAKQKAAADDLAAKKYDKEEAERHADAEHRKLQESANEGAYCVVPGRSTFSVASNGSRLILAAVFDAACAVLAHSGRGLSASRRSAGRRGSLARIGAADDPPTAAPTCRWNVSPSNVRPRTTPSAAAACGASPCPP